MNKKTNEQDKIIYRLSFIVNDEVKFSIEEIGDDGLYLLDEQTTIYKNKKELKDFLLTYRPHINLNYDDHYDFKIRYNYKGIEKEIDVLYDEDGDVFNNKKLRSTLSGYFNDFEMIKRFIYPIINSKSKSNAHRLAIQIEDNMNQGEFFHDKLAKIIDIYFKYYSGRRYLYLFMKSNAKYFNKEKEVINNNNSPGFKQFQELRERLQKECNQPSGNTNFLKR